MASHTTFRMRATLLQQPGLCDETTAVVPLLVANMPV